MELSQGISAPEPWKGPCNANELRHHVPLVDACPQFDLHFKALVPRGLSLCGEIGTD